MLVCPQRTKQYCLQVGSLLIVIQSGAYATRNFLPEPDINNLTFYYPTFVPFWLMEFISESQKKRLEHAKCVLGHVRLTFLMNWDPEQRKSTCLIHTSWICWIRIESTLHQNAEQVEWLDPIHPLHFKFWISWWLVNLCAKAAFSSDSRKMRQSPSCITRWSKLIKRKATPDNYQMLNRSKTNASFFRIPHREVTQEDDHQSMCRFRCCC